MQMELAWGRSAEWKAQTRLSVLDYRDNGSGYFDYRQRALRERVKWERGPWMAELEGGARRRDFSVQTVGIGLSPPLRVKEVYFGNFRVERKISDRWKMFAEDKWERSRCNDPVASYRVNESLLGLSRSW